MDELIYKQANTIYDLWVDRGNLIKKLDGLKAAERKADALQAAIHDIADIFGIDILSFNNAEIVEAVRRMADPHTVAGLRTAVEELTAERDKLQKQNDTLYWRFYGAAKERNNYRDELDELATLLVKISDALELDENVSHDEILAAVKRVVEGRDSYLEVAITAQKDADRRKELVLKFEQERDAWKYGLKSLIHNAGELDTVEDCVNILQARQMMHARISESYRRVETERDNFASQLDAVCQERDELRAECHALRLRLGNVTEERNQETSRANIWQDVAKKAQEERDELQAKLDAYLAEQGELAKLFGCVPDRISYWANTLVDGYRKQTEAMYVVEVQRSELQAKLDRLRGVLEWRHLDEKWHDTRSLAHRLLDAIKEVVE